jgi:hypothetical protein
MEREAARIKSQLEQLNQSYKILTEALNKGHIRRTPGTG